MSEEQKTAVQLETPVGKLGVSGASVNLLFTVLAGVAGCLMIYLLWEHKQEAKESTQAQVRVISDSMKAIEGTSKELLAVQREQLCLLALPQEKRERELTGTDSFCRRISR